MIWIDETSIILGHRRGSIKVWRTISEGRHPVTGTIRTRWNGASEFMWWSYYSYDYKGPFHIWKAETAAEKTAAQKAIDALNAVLEPLAKAEWEITNGTRRIGLRNLPGIAPTWKFTKKTGAYVREKGKGGIDWWRYKQTILIPLLIPFTKQCNMEQLAKGLPPMLVQEDKAPAHSCKYQTEIFQKDNILRLLWPGNSPDLNMIEQCWAWMKRDTTKYGPPENRLTAESVWTRCWNKLPDAKI